MVIHSWNQRWNWGRSEYICTGCMLHRMSISQFTDFLLIFSFIILEGIAVLQFDGIISAEGYL